MLAKVLGVISTILGIAMVGYIVWLTLRLGAAPSEDYALEELGRMLGMLVVYFRVVGGVYRSSIPSKWCRATIFSKEALVKR